MSVEQTFVVVGASLAGTKAVEGMREAGFDGRIVLVGKEKDLPYDRPPLSKGLLKGETPDDEVFLHEPGWYGEARVELRLGTPVDAIDRAAHEVELAGGERLHYDKLLLATGSMPRKLPLPGADLAGVHYLRRLGDARAIRDAVTRGGRVVIVGAGWIGLEVAAGARHHGASVTVVEPAPTPFYGVLGERLGTVFADLHRRNGVDLRTGTGVEAIEGTDTVTGVRLTGGEVVPADAVIIGVGARPNTRLAEAAGLAVDGGVLVDEWLRTSDPDIYAAGDIASVAHALIGERVRVEHWANANDQGLAAGRSMAGAGAPWDVLPFFYTDQYDLGMEYHGWVGAGGSDDLVIRGDVDALDFDAFWLRENQVLAGMHVNRWDDSDPIKELARTRAKVDRDRLADPAVPLSEL
ncbi:MAG TPA: FAD-dependent oxidoreductase [Actinomycetes bacterium]|nr:FAD-dependent oxidoreductase [Actinomycetes bacterium]